MHRARSPLVFEHQHSDGHGHHHDHHHQQLHAIVHPVPSDYRQSRQGGAQLLGSLASRAGLKLGDYLRISTVRKRTAIVRLDGFLPDGDQGTVRFDRFVRQALKAYPHEEVHIERAEPAIAREVVLIPGIDMSNRVIPNLVGQIQRVLATDQAALCEEMLLYIKLPESLAGLTYSVHSVDPPEGIVAESTAIYLEGQDHDHGDGSSHNHEHDGQAETILDTTYQDIGGLTEQLRTVREFIELPLLFPQVYRQLGINPPRGVIFYGAPGTGKTLLARSIASEINAKFYFINGPEVVGTYSGQTEENLRKIFGDASFQPPAIIFIDELDAIAPVRGTTSTLSDTRAVTQLLALLDGLKRAEGVIVIGTTNRVDAIDPALRRAGRFDREVFFPTPSTPAREEILRIHTREMPLAPDGLAALPEIAQRAYGFVGADLMELSREAALNALRRASGAFIDNPSLAAAPAPDDLIVTRADFDLALQRVRPSAMRDSLVSYPNVRWQDIGGLEQIKQRLRDLIEQPLRHPEPFARLGLPTNLGVLLHGPSGTGKTLLAKAIARESGVNFIGVNGPELFSQWLGESEGMVRKIFDTARRSAPAIIFFDQLDALAPRRSAGGQDHASGAPLRVVNQLLAELDGMASLGQVVVVGATNRVDLIDPSLLRPGRFGLHLHVSLPDHADRADILRIHLQGASLAPGVTAQTLIEQLATATEGCSGADLAALCHSAKLLALADVGYTGEPALRPDHFHTALPEIKA